MYLHLVQTNRSITNGQFAGSTPAIGLSFDPSHLVWLQIPNIPGVIREFGSRIYHVDDKDTQVFPHMLSRQGILGNSWWRYRIPGKGSLDWAKIVSALVDVGFNGAIDIENEDPLLPWLNGCEVGRRYLGTVLAACHAQGPFRIRRRPR